MGFTKTIIRAGSGQLPKAGQQVTVHCTGFGKDRDLTQKFWSTKDPGQKPFTFAVGMGQVIKGWDEGVIGMSLGEIAKIHCSPDYAYGACFCSVSFIQYLDGLLICACLLLTNNLYPIF